MPATPLPRFPCPKGHRACCLGRVLGRSGTELDPCFFEIGSVLSTHRTVTVYLTYSTLSTMLPHHCTIGVTTRMFLILIHSSSPRKSYRHQSNSHSQYLVKNALKPLQSGPSPQTPNLQRSAPTPTHITQTSHAAPPTSKTAERKWICHFSIVAAREAQISNSHKSHKVISKKQQQQQESPLQFHLSEASPKGKKKKKALSHLTSEEEKKDAKITSRASATSGINHQSLDHFPSACTHENAPEKEKICHACRFRKEDLPSCRENLVVVVKKCRFWVSSVRSSAMLNRLLAAAVAVEKCRICRRSGMEVVWNGQVG